MGKKAKNQKGAAPKAKAPQPKAKPQDKKQDKPQDNPEGGTMPTVPNVNDKAVVAEAPDAEKKPRVSKKTFIIDLSPNAPVDGVVHEFDGKKGAEVFLNSEEAPEKYMVILGVEIKKKAKISLR